MIEKEKRLLRVGILGCGPIAQFAHFDACKKARNAELFALCDSAEDLRLRMAEIHRPRRVHARAEDLFSDPDVEAVIIGTSDAYHIPLAREAVRSGKHVLLEKPMGVTVEECEELGRELNGTGLVLQVGNNRRFDPGVRFAAEFVREEIGALIGFKCWYYDSFERYTMTDNLQPIPVASVHARKPDQNPKADKRRYFMLTHGSHMVDSARYLAGPIQSVRARLLEKAGAHCWFVETQFASGALGHMDLAIPIQGDFEEGFQLFGEHGSAKGTVCLPWYHKSATVECFSSKTRQYYRPLGEDAFTYKLQLESFADSILHGKPMIGAGVEDGIAAMRAMVAIARSVEQGRMVALNEVTGGV